MRQTFASGSPFETAFGYARAVKVGDTVYVAGTIGRDPDTGTLPEDPAAQYRNAIGIISRALEEAGSSIDDIVQLTTYVASGTTFTEVIGPLMGDTFGHIRPTNTALVVNFPWPGIAVEIQSIAVIGAGPARSGA
ncbi:Rid family hydrolase [Acuticoccus sp. I52.16.1]|uniref:Rid family hydrolase n=1 Tax=Acuticoccus sp. I52.16.1 TaxID=2928472 RepID=UPI001FD34505|nr:Rid family hydrolase [Acuticoccus sp. I52.16.1]UOM34572.1 Rid family hydrolase [Acuticoccus sp. I52.16.1]